MAQEGLNWETRNTHASDASGNYFAVELIQATCGAITLTIRKQLNSVILSIDRTPYGKPTKSIEVCTFDGIPEAKQYGSTYVADNGLTLA